MEFETFQFPDGLRLVFQQTDSPVTHACVLINAGSRDEQPHQYGIAHFIEHLLFKKTERRSTTQILNRLESVGADLNAFTTKEYTCLHASFLTPYLSRALDLFEDLLFHSTFPENEIVKERGVILDEIASYRDSPEDAIQDDFEDLIFKGHGLGHNILGVESDIDRIEKPHIRQFLNRHYLPNRMVIGISGNYRVKNVLRKVEHIFKTPMGNEPLATGDSVVFQREGGPTFTSEAQTRKAVVKPINQVHVVLGSRASNLHDKHKTGTLMLNNLLGGMGMSSRLNMVVREKHGIAYTIESNYTPFSDAGMFTVYFGTDADKYEQALHLIHKEFKKLRDKRLGVGQLHQTKKKFKGQIALAEENRLSLLIGQVKSVLDFRRTQTLEELFAEIDAVQSEDLLEIAHKILDPEALHLLVFKPE